MWRSAATCARSCGATRAAAVEAGARVDDGLPRPDLLLLNGGVFNAPAMIDRLGEVLGAWYGGAIPLLPHTSLETAVAHGAVRSALARRGLGEVIGGGTARAYYIGIEDKDGTAQALCIAPRGMEDGATVDVPDRVFDLVLDQTVAFPLFAYTGDRVDPPGALVEIGDELDAVPALETVLRDKTKGGDTVPVTLKTTITETGALELYLVTVALPPRRWRLEFALASAAGAPSTDAPEESDDAPAPEVADAEGILAERFGQDDPKVIKAVRRDVEKLLGPRGQWSAATCRALWESLMRIESDRGRTDQHELNWLRLTGWTLRPGFGAPDDEERLDRLWAVRDIGLRQRSKQNWSEWWILWRRVAPGLDETRQQALYEDVRPFLWRDAKPPPGPHAHGPIEMMQLIAALEHLPVEAKIAAGNLFFERSKKIGSYWPVGRVGARALLRADPTRVVPPDQAAAWLTKLLDLDWEKSEGAAFAAASIARLTADPTRDIDATLRTKVLDRLTKTKAPTTWLDMLRRPSDLADGDLKRLLGEALPAGLRLT